MAAHFLAKLDAIPEGDGTVLDNTLFVWGNDLAQAFTHDCGTGGSQFLTAGGAGGSSYADNGYTQGFGNGCAPKLVATPMRRLTQATYVNSVKALMPWLDTSKLQLPLDERVGPFVANTALAISDATFSQYDDATQLLAAQAITNMNTLVPCGGALTADCTNTFVKTFGRRLFRRDLDPNELDSY